LIFPKPPTFCPLVSGCPFFRNFQSPLWGLNRVVQRISCLSRVSAARLFPIRFFHFLIFIGSFSGGQHHKKHKRPLLLPTHPLYVHGLGCRKLPDFSFAPVLGAPLAIVVGGSCSTTTPGSFANPNPVNRSLLIFFCFFDFLEQSVGFSDKNTTHKVLL